MKSTGAIIGIFGIWTIISGLLPLAPSAATWNNTFVGLIIGVAGFSLVHVFRGSGAVSGILGLWLIISGLIPAITTSGLLIANNVLVGVIVAVAGLSVAGAPPACRRQPDERRAA